jgi:molecular chaperone DnaK/molecular chaperone HscA
VEHQEIKAAALEVRASITGGDYKIMRKAIEQLDKKTRRFAEIMMDSAVSGALQGKTMASAGENLGEGPTAPHPFAPAQIDSSKNEAPKSQKPDNVLEAAEADPETPAESSED